MLCLVNRIRDEALPLNLRLICGSAVLLGYSLSLSECSCVTLEFSELSPCRAWKFETLRYPPEADRVGEKPAFGLLDEGAGEGDLGLVAVGVAGGSVVFVGEGSEDGERGGVLAQDLGGDFGVAAERGLAEEAGDGSGEGDLALGDRSAEA